jgi:hypothetical protein
MDFQYTGLPKQENNLEKLFQIATRHIEEETSRLLHIMNRKEKARQRWEKIEQMRLDRLVPDSTTNTRVDHLD